MKVQNKAILLTICSALLCTSPLYAEGFKDTKANEWYMDTVNKLVSIGGVKGYEDGTFRPSGTITKAEFISMVVRSMGYALEPVANGHWSQNAFKTAREKGLLKDGELNTQIDSPINRNDMAMLASRALSLRNESIPTDYKEYSGLLYDYAQVPPGYQDAVMKAVAMGVISGYPDKTFDGTRTLTRAEASAVVIRILEPAVRSVPEKPSAVGMIKVGETKLIEQVITKRLEYLNRPALFINYDTITLIAKDPYGLKLVVREGGWLFMDAPGIRNGNLVYIKGSQILKVTGGMGHANPMSVSFTLADDEGSTNEFKLADYLGISNSDEAELVIFPNPFKE